jgi:hypothetical protein
MFFFCNFVLVLVLLLDRRVRGSPVKEASLSLQLEPAATDYFMQASAAFSRQEYAPRML